MRTAPTEKYMLLGGAPGEEHYVAGVHLAGQDCFPGRLQADQRSVQQRCRPRNEQERSYQL
jgi:hypothetical protein